MQVTTITQAYKTYKRLKKRSSSRTYKLKKHPQIAGTNWRLFYHSPKKPNSGKRRVAKVRIKHVKRKDRLTARLTGYNSFPRRFGRLLIRGGRGNDAPGVTYSAVRGIYDFRGHMDKHYRRSFYGVKRYTENIYYIRKSLRRKGIKTLAEIFVQRAHAY